MLRIHAHIFSLISFYICFNKRERHILHAGKFMMTSENPISYIIKAYSTKSLNHEACHIAFVDTLGTLMDVSGKSPQILPPAYTAQQRTH